MSFGQAAQELGIELTPLEVDRQSRRREFHEIYRAEKNKHYQAIANDPSRTKSVAIGKLEELIDKLMREGEHDKAAAVIEKLAKLEGWQGGDSNVNVFAGLTARDIAEARTRIAEGISGKPGRPDAPEPKPSELSN